MMMMMMMIDEDDDGVVMMTMMVMMMVRNLTLYRALCYRHRTLLMSTPSNPSRLRLVTNKKCPFAQKGKSSHATPRFLYLLISPHPTHPIASCIHLITYTVWIAIEEYAGPKGYDLMEVGLYGSGGKPSWFMDINPAGQVPVLWLPTGRIITESDDIIDYLITLPDRKSG